MSDRAVEIAALMLSLKGKAWPEIEAAMLEQFSDATQAEVMRAVDLTTEIVLADAAEHQAEIDAIQGELNRRKGAANG